MYPGSAAAACILVLIGGVVLSGCIQPTSIAGDQGINSSPTVLLLYSTAGSMPQLLNTDKIDGFFVWQPYVAMAQQGGMGKAIAYSEELPLDDTWSDTPCCVLVMSESFLEERPEIAAMVSSLTAAGIRYAVEKPDMAEEIAGRWIFGTDKILIAGTYLDPCAIERESFPTLHFTAGNASTDAGTGDREFSYNDEAAGEGVPVVRIGYLSTDHAAPLFALARDPEYFQDSCNLSLVPVDSGEPRPNLCALVAGGATVAHVELVAGQSGGGLMTQMGQHVIDAAFVGLTPATQQIGYGNPARIVMPLHTGGSALVVDDSAPCGNWTEFTGWARERSKAGRPLIIATVQSSIQEAMIRAALKGEGFFVKLHGV